MLGYGRKLHNQRQTKESQGIYPVLLFLEAVCRSGDRCDPRLPQLSFLRLSFWFLYNHWKPLLIDPDRRRYRIFRAEQPVHQKMQLIIEIWDQQQEESQP